MFTKTAAVVLALAGSFASVSAAPFNATESHLEQRDFGRGTVYLQNGVAGSCGFTHSDNDLIVALSHTYMQHQYKSPWCGRRVQIINHGSSVDVNVKGKGKSIFATVADSCDGCGASDIDLSVGGWNQITSNSAYSVFDAEWYFV